MSYKDRDHAYIQKVKKIPILSSEQEVELARQWKNDQNPNAIKTLVESHLKLVAKIATGYRGYGLPLNDLIAEGNIGIMHALKHFDPEKGYRLSTYASFWIRASIQDYILRTWSIVKIGSTSTQRKLFFGLKKTRRQMQQTHQQENLSHESIELIAKKLEVPVKEVIDMYYRLYKDSSLNKPINQNENDEEWIEWITDDRANQEIETLERDEMSKRRLIFDKAFSCLTERQQKILIARHLTDPPVRLEILANQHDVSVERIRQIEKQAILLLQKAMKHFARDHQHTL